MATAASRESFGTAGNLIQRLGIGTNSGFLVSLADTFCHTDLMVLYNTNRDRGNIPFFSVVSGCAPAICLPFLDSSFSCLLLLHEELILSLRIQRDAKFDAIDLSLAIRIKPDIHVRK